jgi:hypothetical protein
MIVVQLYASSRKEVEKLKCHFCDLRATQELGD